MDSYDLFKQLTRGVRFTKKRTNTTTNPNLPKEKKPKLEIDETKSNFNEIDDVPEPVEPNTANVEPSDISDFDMIYGNTINTTTVSNNKPKKKLKNEKQRQKQLEEEMIQTIRKENNIHVIGKNIPSPFTQFEELHDVYNVSERLVSNLVNCNYAKPTPIQMQAIPAMLKGRNVLACAPTGSGKTIAFLTPIIHDLKGPKKDGFRALVMAPTRELAQQIYRECVRLCEKTALKIHIISKVNQAKQKFGSMSSKKFDVLISTPNRIRYLLKQQPPILDLRSVKWFVIDEADRLMEDGQNNFKEQLEDILSACTYPKKNLALFSATCTVPVAKWAVRNLKQLIRVTIGVQNTTTEFVEQELMFVGSEGGKLLAIRNLVHSGLKPPVLIFLQSKDRAKQLFDELLYDGINVDIIHADRTQQQRDNCVKAFREGHIWVLICTELMGRGIDFKGVNLVINYDFPPSVISYIHRIGRTGRAGRPGKAITFYTHDDTPRLRSIAEIIQKSGGKVPEFMLSLKKTTKAEKKKLNNIVPKREDISTKVKPPNDQKVQKPNMLKKTLQAPVKKGKGR